MLFIHYGHNMGTRASHMGWVLHWDPFYVRGCYAPVCRPTPMWEAIVPMLYSWCVNIKPHKLIKTIRFLLIIITRVICYHCRILFYYYYYYYFHCHILKTTTWIMLINIILVLQNQSIQKFIVFFINKKQIWGHCFKKNSNTF